MRRAIRTVAILLLLGLGVAGWMVKKVPVVRAKAPATHYPAAPVLTRVIKDTKKITVLISVEDWGTWNRGTGVLLDSTHVLTCAHVVKDEGNMMLVYFYPGYVLAHGHTVYSDTAKDLAIVELDVQVNADHYATFTTAHYDGEPIIAVGNAEGSMQWFVNYGIVSGSNARDLFSDRLIFSGDSGGPWVDYDGNIVAISDWGLKSSGIDGGIASHTVRDFLIAYVKILQIKRGGK
jgi:S1-C subfamily serine protease